MLKPKQFILLLLFLGSALPCVNAGEQGHYYPGVLGIRDLVMPPPGKYCISYNPYYHSDDFKDANGSSLGTKTYSGTLSSSLRVRGRSIPVSVTGNLSVDLSMESTFAMQQLLLVWVTKEKFLGADYAMAFSPLIGYMSVDIQAQASAAGTISIGDYRRTLAANGTMESKGSIYGFGDFFFQPLWLGWHGKRYDASVNYGFFAPTGAYTKKRIANVGMGFWTQQLQLNGMYYLNDHKATGVMGTVTYDINSRKYDQDLTPGQSMTLEYAVSHYFNPRIEAGIVGYSQWQISADHGSSAMFKDVFYQVHGVGGQFTGWVIKDKFSVTGKCVYEYYAEDRFRGTLATLNGIWVF